MPPPPYQRPEKNEKNEKQEKGEKGEKGETAEKAEHGFIGYLIGGLILITIGVFAIIDLTNPSLTSSQDLAIMLFVIGIIIIAGAIYVALTSRKHFPQTH
jgi:uncharacterized membrane protein HdeD (DUF308 family)